MLKVLVPETKVKGRLPHRLQRMQPTTVKMTRMIPIDIVSQYLSNCAPDACWKITILRSAILRSSQKPVDFVKLLFSSLCRILKNILWALQRFVFIGLTEIVCEQVREKSHTLRWFLTRTNFAERVLRQKSQLHGLVSLRNFNFTQAFIPPLADSNVSLFSRSPTEDRDYQSRRVILRCIISFHRAFYPTDCYVEVDGPSFL